MSRQFPAETLPAPGERVALDEATSHHLLHVTPIARGATLGLFDGEGRRCEVRLVDVEGGRAVVEGLTEPTELCPTQPLVLVQALPRKPAWETALRMATELGVTELRPFVGRRSVAKKAHPERWGRILRQAARQCGRGDVPTLAPLAPLAEQLDGLDDHRRWLLAPDAPLRERGAPAPVALLVGPEGGLDPEELTLAGERGFRPAGLGRWTLRAETAAVAALALYGTDVQER